MNNDDASVLNQLDINAYIIDDFLLYDSLLSSLNDDLSRCP